MDIEVRRDFERPFIEIRIEGTLSIAGSRDRIARLVENEHYQQGLNLLFDLRQAGLHSLDRDYMQSLRGPDPRLSEGEPASPPTSSAARRVVFLVASEADEMIMKLYKEMLDISPSSPVHDRRVFRNRAAALAWLAGAAAPVDGDARDN